MIGNIRISQVVGIATSIPKQVFDLSRLGLEKDIFNRTVNLTGIYAVSISPENMTAVDYCVDAAQKLLNKLNFDKNRIDGIIFATPHPDYIYPGNCGIVQSKIGISKKSIAMDINHSCTGLVYAFFIADLLIQSNQCNAVLVCCGDTASKHINEKDRSLKMVVGDGGCAALVTDGGKENPSFSFFHDGDGFKYLYEPAGGERMPIKPGITDKETIDEDGNIRTLEDEYMNGLEVMRFVLNEMPALIDDVIKQKKWTRDEIDVYAFHQANEFIVTSLKRKLRIPKEKVLISVKNTGNIGGASVALAMCNFAKEQSYKWKKSVICSFGTGMSGAAMAEDFSNTLFCETQEI